MAQFIFFLLFTLVALTALLYLSKNPKAQEAKSLLPDIYQKIKELLGKTTKLLTLIYEIIKEMTVQEEDTNDSSANNNNQSTSESQPTEPSEKSNASIQNQEKSESVQIEDIKEQSSDPSNVQENSTQTVNDMESESEAEAEGLSQTPSQPIVNSPQESIDPEFSSGSVVNDLSPDDKKTD